MRIIPGQATPQEPPKGPHPTANMIYIAQSDLALDGPYRADQADQARKVRADSMQRPRQT